MRLNYKRLGKYIQVVNERNINLEVKTLLGVSVKKIFIPSIANTVGTDFKKYKIVKKHQFVYIPDTSRRGEKIGIAMLDSHDKALVSQAYTVFEIIDDEALNAEYLMMWFRRPEFDRYARFKSHGTVREIFDWDEVCDIELPIPSIEKQREIVKEYNTIVNRIKLNETLNQKLEDTAQALYKHWFVDFDFPFNSPPSEGCPQDGVVVSSSKENSSNPFHKRNTQNYKSLPYNPKLKERAKALRKAGNLAEVLLWKQVKNKQFKGLDFDRQKIIGNYIVDFYCANTQTVIEIDGSSHDNKQEYDAKRTNYLISLGLQVIHISTNDVKQQMEATMRWLEEHEAFLPPRLSGTPPKEGNLPSGYKSSGGEMVYNEELDMEIPEGWEVQTIDEVSKLTYGKMLDSKLFLDSGYPVFSGYGIRGYYSEFMYELSQILVLCRGVSGTGRVEMSPPFSYITNLSIVVRLNEKLLNKEFCYYYLRNDNLRSLDSGSAQSQITTGDLGAHNILVPNFSIQSNFGNMIEKINGYSNQIKLTTEKLEKTKNIILSKMSKVETKTVIV
ncbi:DUF559 domain-containing protein [Polaribacter sp.]|uniref:DUF559 domain-containing protein n=1 Tax=Polaribacter sp. TaxID=1920175 RepID=UPI003EF7061A